VRYRRKKVHVRYLISWWVLVSFLDQRLINSTQPKWPVTIPFRFSSVSLDNAVDGLKYEQSTEDDQSPEMISSCDAGRAPDSEDGVYEKQQTSEDRLDASQYPADTHSLHCVTSWLQEHTAHVINSHRNASAVPPKTFGVVKSLKHWRIQSCYTGDAKNPRPQYSLWLKKMATILDSQILTDYQNYFST